MVAEHPQIARLADGGGPTLSWLDLVLRIPRLAIGGLKRLDVIRLEAEDGDVQPFGA